MSTELVLNLLVAFSVTGALMTARLTPIVAAVLRDRAKITLRSSIAVSLSGMASRGLWVALAFETRRWQFAAITLLPWLVGLGARAAAMERLK